MHVDILDMSGSGPFQAHHGDPLQPGGFDMQDTGSVAVPHAAANRSLTLRDVPRFQLFSPNTTIFEYAGCPFVSPDLMHGGPPAMLIEGPQLPEGGVRYYHQTCLHRGEHLRHYRRVLHWSGSSNINPKKKNAGRRDMVKVTGRTALCDDCLNAFAIAINADVNEMLPKETDPERRQRKVVSRRRLTHGAKEQPALEEAHNMVFSMYVTATNQLELKETASFAELRATVPDVNAACQVLETAIRSHLHPEIPLELQGMSKRSRAGYHAENDPRQALPQMHREAQHHGNTSTSLDIGLDSLDTGQADMKPLQQPANSFGEVGGLQAHSIRDQHHDVPLSDSQHVELSDTQQPDQSHLSELQHSQHVHMSDAVGHMSDVVGLPQIMQQPEYVLQ